MRMAFNGAACTAATMVMHFTREETTVETLETKAFEDRKLDVEIADRMGSSFRNGQFRFEYRDRGELRFTKVRTIDKRFWIEPKGQPLLLWNIDSLRDMPCRPKEALV